ncbi:unnamed protein product, partial [Mesorhabditis belari]|uniref:Sidoreflexin n=1 Tax=Mesorhabditis belari TaxID=2138241 RepID=A0AAF3F911_9BILA
MNNKIMIPPNARVIDVFPRPDLSRPRWDQNTYKGRALHFFTTVNPMNIFVTSSKLEQCREIVKSYRKGQIDSSITVEELWKAKHLYDSAFHPDTGNKMFLPGRMSFQVWGNMVITGGMLTFYRRFHHVIFWQWINQSFNAVVNYTNRSGSHAASTKHLFVSYCCATGSALFAALYLNSLVKDQHSLRGRLVPFAAIAIANVVNIPIMRSNEFSDGIPVEDREGNVLVVLSRIGMTIPSFIGIPLIMNIISRKAWYKSRSWISIPIQSALAGFCLTFSTPLACALFPQKSSIKVSHLEQELREKIALLPHPPEYVYYNKGL